MFYFLRDFGTANQELLNEVSFIWPWWFFFNFEPHLRTQFNISLNKHAIPELDVHEN